jgi:hypothetical protein
MTRGSRLIRVEADNLAGLPTTSRVPTYTIFKDSQVNMLFIADCVLTCTIGPGFESEPHTCNMQRPPRSFLAGVGEPLPQSRSETKNGRAAQQRGSGQRTATLSADLGSLAPRPAHLALAANCEALDTV